MVITVENQKNTIFGYMRLGLFLKLFSRKYSNETKTEQKMNQESPTNQRYKETGHIWIHNTMM